MVLGYFLDRSRGIRSTEWIINTERIRESWNIFFSPWLTVPVSPLEENVVEILVPHRQIAMHISFARGSSTEDNLRFRSVLAGAW